MKCVKVQNYLPAVGEQFPCHILLRRTGNKIILLFEEGTSIAQDEVDRFSKYHSADLLYVKEEDYLRLIDKEMKKISGSLSKNGKIDHLAGKEVSKALFRSEAVLDGEDKLDSMVKMAGTFVKEMLSQSTEKHSLMVAEIFKDLENSSGEFSYHANQVAAISSMLALMVEDLDINNIIEINLGAILHGMGLMVFSGNPREDFFEKYAKLDEFDAIGNTRSDVANGLIQKHVDGHRKLTTNDEVIFLKHISLINLNIKKIKNVKVPGIERTMNDFKMIMSSGGAEKTQVHNAYISAKILAVGDRLVSLMNFYQKNPHFVKCAASDLIELSKASNSAFDPKIINTLNALLE